MEGHRMRRWIPWETGKVVGGGAGIYECDLGASGRNQQKDIRKVSLTKRKTMGLNLAETAGISADFTVKIINASTGEARTASSRWE